LDQRGEYHFRNYAKALVGPIPNHSILLVNYDQQWTSIRYLLECENYRKKSNITVINLSMMTYKWFATKQHLYPHIRFPKGYHGRMFNQSISQHESFTLYSFLKMNMKKYRLFLSGKLSYPEKEIDEKFEMVPVGEYFSTCMLR
jgi:hypothetical protein